MFVLGSTADQVAARPDRVSILVLLDVGHRTVRRFRHGGSGQVSILVLLDVGLGHGYSRGPYPIRVQSLFFWMLVLGLAIANLSRATVSILVLLDVGHRAEGGSPSGPGQGVSILVLLDVCHQAPSLDGRAEDKADVSILVLLDDGHRAPFPTEPGYGLTAVSILVLLDVGHRELEPRTMGPIAFSFNPCSSGCWSLGHDSLFLTPTPWEFQSLFFWMLVIGIRLCVRSHFVRFNPCSSGCWSSGSTVSSWPMLCLSFNPCSSGCWSSGSRSTISSSCRFSVSILVLLDVGHRGLG